MTKLVVAMVILITAFWVAWVIQAPIFRILGVNWNYALLGSWGETFGAFSALFSAFAFGGVILTLKLQQDQIAQARKQSYLEQFDKTFFQLLDLFFAARSQIRFRNSMHYLKNYPGDRELKTGISAFRYMWLEVTVLIDASELQETVQSYERSVHSRCETTLGPYFRLLYTMLRRIDDDTVLSEAERVRYGNLLRSQITSYEVAITALNGLSYVSKDLSELLIKYRFLKYLPSGKRRERLQLFYPEEAFVGRTASAAPKLFFRPQR